VHHEIRVKGVLDNRLSAWFDGLQVTRAPAERGDDTGASWVRFPR
jgi:hypothetical protein